MAKNRKIRMIAVLGVCALLAEYVISAENAAALLKQADTFRTNKQYDQAEQLYLALATQNTPEAFTAQQNLTILYISMTPPQLDRAEAAYQELLNRFAKNEGLSQAIYEISRTYDKISQTDEALQLHQSNVERYPNDLYGMYSQVEIIKSDIGTGDWPGADGAYKKLLIVFAKQPTLAKEIYQLARRYEDAGEAPTAQALDQYNAEHFGTGVYGMCDLPYGWWAQANLHVRQGNQTAGDALVDKILAGYPNDPATQQGVFQLAEVYRKALESDRAVRLYKYHIEHWPQAKEALEVRKQLAFAYIDLSDDSNAAAMVTQVLTSYAKHARITKTAYDLGLHYSRADKLAEAIKLHLYNVEHGSKDDPYTMRSQVELAKAYVRDGNDVRADAAVNALLTTFAKQETLPTDISHVADTYFEAGRYDKADQLYQFVLMQHPAASQALWATAGKAKLDLVRGDEVAGTAALDKMIAEFKTHPDLNKVLLEIAEGCYRIAFEHKEQGRIEQARASFRVAASVADKVIPVVSGSETYGPLAYQLAADCCHQLGQHRKAVEYCQRIQATWPQYEFPREYVAGDKYCGAYVVWHALEYYGLGKPIGEIVKEMEIQSKGSASIFEIVQTLKANGVSSRAVKLDPQNLRSIDKVLILYTAPVQRGQLGHFVECVPGGQDKATILDGSEEPRLVDLSYLRDPQQSHWDGTCIILEAPNTQTSSENGSFSADLKLNDLRAIAANWLEEGHTIAGELSPDIQMALRGGVCSWMDCKNVGLRCMSAPQCAYDSDCAPFAGCIVCWDDTPDQRCLRPGLILPQCIYTGTHTCAWPVFMIPTCIYQRCNILPEPLAPDCNWFKSTPSPPWLPPARYWEYMCMW